MLLGRETTFIVHRWGMASIQDIKKRLGGIKSIKQMTSAMELVAATKMRRAQEAALSSRPYAFAALEILANLVESIGEFNQSVTIPLVTRRPVKKAAIFLVAADKGLAGAFNSSIFRKLETYLEENPAIMESDVAFVAIGQKAADYVRRKNFKLEARYTHFGDMAEYHEIEPLADLLLRGYTKETWDRVIVFSTHFVSTLRQEVLTRELLPIEFSKIRTTVEDIIPQTGRYAELRRSVLESRPARPIDYLIEPSPRETLEALLPLLFKMQIYHLILEANASEHSARRMAMKNASDNASDLISNLTLEYNRSRQAAITKEISEITGTAAALKK